LLLISYIENAFKYGVNTEDDSFIHIQIIVFENQLNLTVKNSMVLSDIVLEEKSGNGMENTKKRLQVLYPNKHQLSIKSDNAIYEVDLKLFLI
jgi:LytS/YehU family sensor histidine kinase